MTWEEYNISKIRVKASRIKSGTRLETTTGYVSKIEWTPAGEFDPVELTLDDGRVVPHEGWYIEEILPDKDDFEERLRKLLLEIDIESPEYPDPDYAGAMIWEFYLRKRGVERAEDSDSMKKYRSELYTAIENLEKEELKKRFNT